MLLQGDRDGLLGIGPETWAPCAGPPAMASWERERAGSPGVAMLAVYCLLAHAESQRDLLPGPAIHPGPGNMCALQLLDQPPQGSDGVQALTGIVVGGSGDKRCRSTHARQRMLTN